MNRRSLLRLSVVLVLSSGSFACATAPQASGPAPTLRPVVRCRTVLEVRPGALGTASNPVPVQRCEPEIPTSAPPPESQDEPPLGTRTTPDPSVP